MIPLLLLLLIFGDGFASKPVVTLKNGMVTGNRDYAFDDTPFLAFEGIPYAKPPVGDLRFEEAQPAEPWEGTLGGNRMYSCLQYFPIPGISGIMGNEDCLYINVYTPGKEIDPQAKLDVVAHIHGGAFILGSPKTMAGPLYVMTKNVIYITFNYRLGIFGFLSTEDDVVPGNNGLKDQVLALKWIQDNVEAFGGNPNSVTLTGLSAGSSSIHFHSLSPKSKGLFHRGMCMSGTSLVPWALVENAHNKSVKLGNIMDCPSENSKELVDCLRTKNARDLAGAIKEFFFFGNMLPPTPFGPVIEKGSDPFLGEHPYKLLQDGKILNDVPMIFSSVKDEGIFPVGVLDLFGMYDNFANQWDIVAPYALDFQDTLPDSDQIEAVQKITKYYFGENNIDRSVIMFMVKVFSDRYFNLGIEEAARMHAKAATSKVYYYYYSYQPVQFNPFKLNGTAHTFDGMMMFKFAKSSKNLKRTDKTMMEMFTNLLYNWGKDNKPAMGDVEWKPVEDGEKIGYLHIQSPSNIFMEETDEFAPTKFWKSLNIQENGNLF